MKKNIHDTLQLIVYSFTQTVGKLFSFLPIKENRILFCSYQGEQYSCNPKYIYEYINQNYPQKFECIWAFKSPKQFEYLKNNKGTVICKYRTLSFYYYRLTSKILISNSDYCPEIKKRKGQYLINTWHGGGGGYKKLGLSLGKRNKIIDKRYMLEKKDIDLICASSMTSYKNTVIGSFHHYGDFLKGTPRNDMFVNNDRQDVKDLVYKAFGLSSKQHIALYAPTYRTQDEKGNIDYGLDFQGTKIALEKKFGGEWVILLRYHYFLINKYVFPDIDGLIDATNYSDMQELLYASDILITDYSSSIWDYSFTLRPCFLFCSDLDEYTEKHGFNKPISSWGFPVACTNDQFFKIIRQFDEKKFIENMKKHHEENGSFEDGTATKRMVDIIYEKCFGNFQD